MGSDSTPRLGRVVRGSDGPFDAAGVERSPDGVPRYTTLAESVPAGLQAAVRRAPDAEAVVEVGGGRLTYAELWDSATAVAGGLRAAGVQPGDRVAVDLPGGIGWVTAFAGIQIAGAVLVPVNTRLSPDERRHVLDDSACALVIDAEHPAPVGPAFTYDAATRGDLAAIFYTSGTTGRSKGATSTHEALLAVAENVHRAARIPKDLGPELRTLVCVPLFHVTGFAAQLVPTLLSGGTVVIQEGLDVPLMLETLAAERITMLVAVPAVYFYLLTHPAFAPDAAAGLRWALYGGAPIAPELVARVRARLPHVRVANGFGMSETSSLATLLPHEDSETYADSIGYPCPVVDVAIIDPDRESGAGEIALRGQTVTAGYWQADALNADATSGGWLRTGDVGRLDADGRLYLVDRLKAMINRGGENVYSVEVENALADAPGVGEVAVVGVPDEMMGEKVGCVIVPADGDLDVGAVLAHVADYKVPQYVAVREEPLPRNPGGKVLKTALRDGTAWGPPVRGR